MGVSQKAAQAYTLFKTGKKIRTYGKLVKESIDEDTRSGALMKLGIRGMLEIAGKALGTSLTSHPYFAYHKAHLEALAQAMNATSNLDGARAALDRAIRSADASAAITKALADYRSRRNGLRLTYGLLIRGSLLLLRDRETDPKAALQIREAGQTPQSLQARVDRDLYEWRANYCDLYRDSVQLLAMEEVELRATEAAMQRFDKKMSALSSGGSIGRIAGYRMEEDRQWQQFDRMTHQSAGSAQAVKDPVGYTRKHVDDLQRMVDRLEQDCEAAMSDDAYKPDLLLLHLGKA